MLTDISQGTERSGLKYKTNAASRLPLPEGKAESRDEFANRMARTAHALPASFIDKPIGDMAARWKKLYDERRGLFEEGAEKKRRPL